MQGKHEQAAVVWEQQRAAQDQQLAEVKGQLQAALQQGSIAQDALHALQQEATQQVPHLNHMCTTSSLLLE